MQNNLPEHQIIIHKVFDVEFEYEFSFRENREVDNDYRT